MANLALIQPPNVKPASKGYTTYEAVPPLGLAYIAGSAVAAGHNVTVIDGVGSALDQYTMIENGDYMLQGLTFQQVSDRIPPQTLVIGITISFSSSWFFVDKFIRFIKAQHPHAFIVLGGEHVTAEWHAILYLNESVDYCVLGEGEDTFLELIDHLSGVTDVKVGTIKGLGCRINGQIVKTDKRQRIKDINQIPEPYWKAFPLKEYLDRGYAMTGQGFRSVPILASRGCPYSCTFCSSPQMWGTELSLRDPQTVVNEIKSYVRDYRVQQVEFLDIVGVINKKWTHKLMDILIEENLDVQWIFASGTRSEILDPDLLKKFKLAKVARIIVAPETGSKKTIKEINKNANLDKILRAVAISSTLSIPTKAQIIVAIPGQTKLDHLLTLYYSLKLTWAGLDDIGVNIFIPYPGSKLHRTLTSEGKLPSPQTSPKEYDEHLRSLMFSRLFVQKSYSEHIKPWMMYTYQLGTMFLNYAFQFLIRPQRMFQSLNRAVIIKRPITFIDNMFYNLSFRHRKFSAKQIE